MTRRLMVALACWTLLPAVAHGQAARTPKKLRLAVMEIRPLGTEPIKAELLSEVALTEAARFKPLETIGKSDITSLLGLEQQQRVLGCSEDSSCLAQLGGALGVDYLLVGSLGRLGALYRVDLKLVDPRKAKVLGRAGESVAGDEEKLVAAVQRAVRELLVPVAGEPSAAGGAPGARGPAAVTTQFDSAWLVTLGCPDDTGKSGAKGYTWELPGTITKGLLVADYGVRGEPASLHIEGPVQPDGSAELWATGRTGKPEYAVNRSAEGSAYTYQVKAQLEGTRGTGTRVSGRPCHLTFTKR